MCRHHRRRPPSTPELASAVPSTSHDAAEPGRAWSLGRLQEPVGWTWSMSTAAAQALDQARPAAPGGRRHVRCLRRPCARPRPPRRDRRARRSHPVSDVEQVLDGEAGAALGPDALELTNAALIRVKDGAWAIRRDRLRTARCVGDLAGAGAGPAAIEAFWSVQVALSALDRLEVRGRDSAGLHLLVRGHGLDLADPAVRAAARAAHDRPAVRLGAVRVAGGDARAFVYKAAAEIGELGDNTASLRAALTLDELLHLALQSPDAEVTVLGHTRWASVGIISQANAHPLNSEEDGRADGPYVVGALNGDVDNFADLKASDGLHIAAEITTDAKVIPTLVSRRLAGGDELTEAFRATVAGFEGSVAIGASTAARPDDLYLALRGSGQGVYVGLADDAFVVASEPYGVVEECRQYLRMDGETPSDPDNPTASRGQIVVARRARAGGARRHGAHRAYDGTGCPCTDDDVATAHITTRDVDRGDAPHYLLKEITEAPESFRKTLRGKLVERAGGVDVVLGDETLPPDVAEPTSAPGEIRRVRVIGQGTAAVAGLSRWRALLERRWPTAPCGWTQITATELSGFGLRDDMSDTLIVAISQSGTTTDTNRTVDLARARGARVVAIVNRRSSDLTDKSDGVLYTSDGRDVEMSVASTKAFYAQVAAGALLACAITAAAGVGTDRARHELLTSLRDVPAAMREVARRRRGHRRGRAALRPAAPLLGDRGQRHQPDRRARAADQAVRALLQGDRLRLHRGQEAHRSLVGAAHPRVRRRAHRLDRRRRGQGGGDLPGPQGHADRHRQRRRRALRQAAALGALISVPAGAPGAGIRAVRDGGTPVRLRSRAGHRRPRLAPLREAREPLIEDRRLDPRRVRGRRRPALRSAALVRAAGRPLLRRGAFRRVQRPPRGGHQPSRLGLAAPLRRSERSPTREPTSVEHGQQGRHAERRRSRTSPPRSPRRHRSRLTRPVDAIKHQAKTVTVGISRSDEGVSQVPLVRERARRRCRPRRSRLPGAAHPRRARPGGGRDRRLHALPDRGRCRRPRGPPITRRRPRQASSPRPAAVASTEKPTRCCGARSTGWPPSAR